MNSESPRKNRGGEKLWWSRERPLGHKRTCVNVLLPPRRGGKERGKNRNVEEKAGFSMRETGKTDPRREHEGTKGGRKE